jgi:ATP-dependent RNA helicase DeaD
MSTAPQDPTPQPVTFQAIPLSLPVRRAVDELGYHHPTPVQLAVYAPASKGRDLVVQARTGTGKTAAFGLPIVDALVRTDQPSVQVLVLCPTRELALQVKREVTALGKYREVAVVSVYGGAPMPRQIEEIRAGAQVVVGTPGRVLDHLERGTLDPKGIKVLVLDEADEMLSMGFLPQITDILSALPPNPQTLLFSATLPNAILRMAQTRLREPEFVTLSGDQVGALEIQHIVYLNHGDRLANLVSVIETENPESAIIFCNTKDETKRAAAHLQAQGYDADWLNADLPQKDRERVMAATREGRLRFLVATDVAARGIDISHLTHVINHEFPESPENYIHRTGRTGRAGRTGTAISLVSPANIGNLYMMRLTYGIRAIERQLPSQRELATRSEMDLVDMFVSAFASRPQHPGDLSLARRLLTHEQAEKVIAGLLRDHLGARPEAPEAAAAARRAAPPRPAPQAPQGTPAPSPEATHAAPGPQGSATPLAAKPGSSNGSEPRLESKGPAREPREARGHREPRAPREPREAKEPRERRRVDEPFGYTVEGEDPSLPQQAQSRSALHSEPRDREAEIFVNIGKRDGLRAEQLLEVLEAAGLKLPGHDVVRVRDKHSFVSVQREKLEDALKLLDGRELVGRTARAEEARR